MTVQTAVDTDDFPKHSKLGMSARSRWSKCAKSVPWSDGLPDEPGPAAEEGTRAHTVAEFYVRQRFGLAGAEAGEAPEQVVPVGLDLKGQTPEQWNEKLRYHGKQYAAWLAEFIGTSLAHIVLERRVAISGTSPPLFGTADCLIWFPTERQLAVIDYKYGFGEVEVGTADAPNEQAAGYAVAACEDFKLEPADVSLGIYQPRRIHGEPGQLLALPGHWIATERAKILAEAREVRRAYDDETMQPVPGKHCRYCRASSRCPTTHHAGKTALKAYVSTSMVHEMTDEEIIALWSVRTAFKNFWEDVEERIAKMAGAGTHGLVMKVSQGRRVWADPQTAALTLLALGRADLVQPCALSDALPAIPAEMHDALIGRAAGAKTISTVDTADPATVAGTFDKYVRKT
jgi:hypothetical protein